MVEIINVFGEYKWQKAEGYPEEIKIKTLSRLLYVIYFTLIETINENKLNFDKCF